MQDLCSLFYVGAQHAAPGLPVCHDRAQHASPLQQSSPDHPLDAGVLGRKEFTEPADFPEQPQNLFRLADPHLEQEPAARLEIAGSRWHDQAVEVKAVSTAIQCLARLEVPYLRLESCQVGGRNVGGVGDDRSKRSPGNGSNRDPSRRVTVTPCFSAFRRAMLSASGDCSTPNTSASA